MKYDGKHEHGNAEGESKPTGDRRKKGPRRQKGFVERATAMGHSGYGADSVRPHLRDQLQLKALLRDAWADAPGWKLLKRDGRKK